MDNLSQITEKPLITEVEHSLLFHISALVLLFVGLFGNTISLLVFSRQTTTPQNIFFVVLAFSDSCLLCFGLITTLVYSQSSWGASTFTNVNNSLFGCKVYSTAVKVTSLVSNWMLVALTTERALSVILPHRVKTMSTTKRAMLYVIIIMVSSILYASYFLWNKSITQIDGIHVCMINLDDPTFKFFWQEVRPWIDPIVISLIPALLIITSNVIIACTVIR